MQLLGPVNKITAFLTVQHRSYLSELINQTFISYNLQICDQFSYDDITDSELVVIATDDIKTLPTELVAKLDLTSLSAGAFEIQFFNWLERPYMAVIGGDLAGVIYAIQEIKQRYLQVGNYLKFTSTKLRQIPTLPYRLFWTWDHTTNWQLDQCGQQEFGCFNDYSKTTDAFIQDYQRLIDFMSLNRVSGITIYGFLRDSHGGIDAAQQICNYAQARGVRILPGVGINAYGGIYWQGEHRYNLHNWLTAHPELRAQYNKPAEFNIPDLSRKISFPQNGFTDAACPSKTENLQYHVEAIQWLCETFAIGGVNFESGDYALCYCDDCKSKRKTHSTWSLHDMINIYPVLFDVVKQTNPTYWNVCETYWDNLLEPNALEALVHLPDSAIYQFCCNRSYWQKIQTELTKDYVNQLPKSTNILRTHMGSQWNDERYQLVAKRYAQMMHLLYSRGMQGATIFSEVSAFNVSNEINYLAFSRFGYDATLTWDNFLQQELSPRLGGDPEAELFINLLDADIRSTDQLDNNIGVAKEISSTLSGDPYRRWIWLINELHKKQQSL